MTPSNRNTGGMFCAALLPCALIMACAGGQTMDNSEELAISKVVLYQNGVGYFERSGEMRGRQLSLRVRPDHTLLVEAIPCDAVEGPPTLGASGFFLVYRGHMTLLKLPLGFQVDRRLSSLQASGHLCVQTPAEGWEY